jgi:hypothetical protein
VVICVVSVVLQQPLIWSGKIRHGLDIYFERFFQIGLQGPLTALSDGEASIFPIVTPGSPRNGPWTPAVIALTTYAISEWDTFGKSMSTSVAMLK